MAADLREVGKVISNSTPGRALGAVLAAGVVTFGADAAAQTVRVERLADAPIIGPGLHPSIGENIQGPSLIRVPDWVADPLGAYYLYFADHKGRYIRLAYADDLRGPWRVHPPGSLQIGDSHFLTEPPRDLARGAGARPGGAAGAGGRRRCRTTPCSRRRPPTSRRRTCTSTTPTAA